MGNVKVVMNNSVCNDLRNSPEVQAKLLEVAQTVSAQAAFGANGVACGFDVQPGRTRAHARVWISGGNSKGKTKLMKAGAGGLGKNRTGKSASRRKWTK